MKNVIISSKARHRIKQGLRAEDPTVWVGKEGSTTQIVNEISRQLEKREIVKAKILQTALKNEEARDIAAKMANQTGATLIDVRGHTFVLYKPKKKGKATK